MMAALPGVVGAGGVANVRRVGGSATEVLTAASGHHDPRFRIRHRAVPTVWGLQPHRAVGLASRRSLYLELLAAKATRDQGGMKCYMPELAARARSLQKLM